MPGWDGTRARRLAGLALTLALAGACGGPAQASPPTMDGSVSIAMRELRYTCASLPFDPIAFAAGPRDAERGPGAKAVALRAVLAGREHGGMLPDRGWYLAGEDARIAEFVAATDGKGMVHVTLQTSPDGWQLAGWGDCQARVHLAAGLNAATWTLADGSAPPDPSTHVFDALVTESACAGGQPADGRILDPWVAVDGQRILVVFAVRAGEGPSTCQGNPSSLVRVDLGEPLGQRQLLDGGRFPAGDPTEPAF